MHFSDIPEYEAIKNQLISVVVTQKVPSAYLFSGVEGTPHLSLALAFAAYLNCPYVTQDDSCGQCSSCVKMKKIIHPDLQFVFPVSTIKQANTKVAVRNNSLILWRNFLKKSLYGTIGDWSDQLGEETKQLYIIKEDIRHCIQQVALKACEGAYKIVLIWLPEYLHAAAANSFLKILEEPPLRTVFLLVSNYPDKILHTLRSRTQQHHILPFSDKAIEKLVTQHHNNINDALLSQIVTLADGNLNKALKLVYNTTDENFERFKNWMRSCYAQNMELILNQAESFYLLSRALQKNFLMYTLKMLRATLMIHFSLGKFTKLLEIEEQFLKNFSKNITYPQLKEVIQWINQSCYYLEKNANAKILYTSMSINLSRMFQNFVVKS